ncbi:MAG: 3-deoxy-8-phosphooctulonate synthase [Chlorobiales bacterium]|nr:3-deoxy-8-phosphooctulonate synthase [Chlorobiales bacterium]
MHFDFKRDQKLKTVKFRIGSIHVGSGDRLLIIAGPCVVENREMIMNTAKQLKAAAARADVDLIFKASYRKANRTSAESFTGIGNQEALEILADVREKYGLPILTDIHSPEEAELAARYTDVLQIPAFLSRQTELLQAAGKTGRVVNIKKGQFMAPGDMGLAAEKVAATGNKKIMLTERGASFGYHNLVVDFRGLPQMAAFGYPVIFDATHSVQLPSAGNGVSSGDRKYILPLARAAVAVGVTGVFMEVHPNPAEAKSDAATQLPLSRFGRLVKDLKALFELSKTFEKEI